MLQSGPNPNIFFGLKKWFAESGRLAMDFKCQKGNRRLKEKDMTVIHAAKPKRVRGKMKKLGALALLILLADCAFNIEDWEPSGIPVCRNG